MNDFTKAILTEILQLEGAWNKKTRELDYNWVYNTAYHYQLALYVPLQERLLRRAVHLCHVLTCLPPEAYCTVLQDGEEKEFFEEDWLTDFFTGHGDDWMSYIAGIWYGHFAWAPDMSFEVTREEMLSLNIRPNYVPAKPGQPSLF